MVLSCKQLMKHLESNGFLSEHQFGFRPNHSTELAVTFFTDLIRKEADGGKATGAVFIDLSKAFDTISHFVLLEKLSRYGIQENELNWFSLHSQVYLTGVSSSNFATLHAHFAPS